MLLQMLLIIFMYDQHACSRSMIEPDGMLIIHLDDDKVPSEPSFRTAWLANTA